jgi:hypothetical protein
MPGLAPHEVYRAIKSVELRPVLAILDRLPFVHVNQGSTGVNPACDVVLADKFPPELRALIAELGLGGETARAILRRLTPRQGIAPHVDAWMPAEADWRRFQVPITSHPDIVMRWPDDGIAVHLAPGFLYEVRFDRLHEVVHGADCARTHLQIDQVNATL